MLSIAKKAAQEAGKVLTSYFQKELAIEYKSNVYNLVTKADFEAQKIIIDTIVKEMSLRYPGVPFGFIAEEKKISKPKRITFIIDPLDGTTNFASGLDYFSVSIAVVIDETIEAGVVYDVTRDTFYTAEKGKGAYKNGVRFYRASKKILQEAILLCYRRSGMVVIPIEPFIARDIRMLGSLALDFTRIAEGVGDVLFSRGGYIWDIAAGILVLSEAGGKTVDWNGQPFPLNLNNSEYLYPIIVSNDALIKEILPHLKKIEA